jgi:hypothetical protein
MLLTPQTSKEKAIEKTLHTSFAEALTEICHFMHDRICLIAVHW